MNADLLHFLQSQRLLVLATQGDTPWVANLYYGADEHGNIYFVSGTETKHSNHIADSSTVAFSIAWFDTENYTNRKAIQGLGSCRIAKGAEIETGIALHNTHFPTFADRITVDYILDDANASQVWIIEPTYMKFWNDELYGINGHKEYTF